MRINDRVSILHNGETYRYTIEDYEVGNIGIIEVCNVLNKNIRECLDITELREGYINSYNGNIYFKEKDKAEDFIKYLKDSNPRYF